MELKPGYKQTEIGLIPDDWLLHSCSEVTCLITVGIVIRPKQYYATEGVPALRSANIRENRIDRSGLVFIKEEANRALSKSQIQEGDVLTVRTGYPGTSAVVTADLHGSNCIDILISRPSATMNSVFLAAWINSKFGKIQVLKNQGGLAQQHFNVSDMRSLVVPLPTRAEQDAIAGALSDTDALIEALEQLIAKKRHIKQGAMGQLLTGKKRLPGFETKPGTKQTEVGEIPVDWNCSKIANLASSNRNAIVGGPFGSDLGAADYVKSGIPVIRGQNMLTRWVSGSFVFVTSQKASSLSANLAVAGDLVFTQRGTLGQVSIIPKGEFLNYLLSQSQMKATICKKKACFEFVYYACKAEAQQKWIKQSAIQTGVPHINLSILRRLPVPLPSTLAEQESIATVLSDMDAEIQALEAKLQKTRQLKQGMMAELLTGRIRLI